MATTCGQLLDRLVQLGIAPPTRRLEHASLLDEEVEVFGATLADLGVAVWVDGDGDGEVGLAYQDVIEEAAALSNGTVVITDVTFDHEARDDQLSFRINDRPATWWMEAYGPGYWIFDKAAVWGQIRMLAPGGDDPRAFYLLESVDLYDGDAYLLLTKEQAEALCGEFGLDLDPVP